MYTQTWLVTDYELAYISLHFYDINNSNAPNIVCLRFDYNFHLVAYWNIDRSISPYEKINLL